MLTRVVFCAALAALIVTPTLAATNPPADDNACAELLEQTEASAAEENIADTVRAKIDEALDKLEQQCSAGEYKEAAKTVDTIIGMMPK